MAHKDQTRFLRMALNLKMIDAGQFNEIMELWEKNPTKDTGTILLEKGFITQEQYKHILSTFIAHGEALHNFDVSATRIFIHPREKHLVEKDELTSGKKEPTGEAEELYSDIFTLRGILGQGGIGRVFLGFDKNIEREVAIKELIAEKADAIKDRNLARFIREAKVTGQLEHPGIVPVYELNAKPDGTYFYVMKYVHGRTLYEGINSCFAETPEAAFRERLTLLPSLIDVCEAMGYAHSKGVIHRDLKPSNVILGEFGETIILDWGLAKAYKAEASNSSHPAPSSEVEDDADSMLTRQGEMLGTPSYMSPEQIDSRFGQVGPESDVYALGVILFMILTGEKPYQGKAKEFIKLVACDEPSPTPRTFGPFIPPELAAICEKAMAKQKKDRFANASEMASELKAYRDGRLVSVYAYSKKELFRRFIARNKIAISAAAAVGLSIIIGAGFALHFAADAHMARKSAERALVDVTDLSEAAMKLSRNATSELSNYFNNLSAEMKQVSIELATINLAQGASLNPYLKNLYKRHPEVEAFIIMIPPGKITATFPEQHGAAPIIPIDYNQLASKFKDREGAISNIFKTAKGFPAFAIGTPIRRQLKVAGTLLALMKASKVIPISLSFDPLKSDYQVWCMQENGYILYDEDPQQVGLFLFTDSMYAKFPELLTFGNQMKQERWGVGHYIFTAKGGIHEVYKIAAWDTIRPLDETNWKIVVTYPYTTK